MASMCTDASDDLLNTESLVFPEVQCQVDQDCSNPPSTNDASYVIFLIESYFLLFPDKSAYMADVLCYTPYLPQRFISPIMGLLAPPILTEMSLDLQTTNRNRCILGLIFVNAVLAQTVSAYQYAITSRCLLKQMKFSWIRAYIPLSVLSSNVYFFGARSKVFQITILDDDEYISEVRLLLNNQPYKTESLKNGSQKNSIRRSKTMTDGRAPQRSQSTHIRRPELFVWRKRLSVWNSWTLTRRRSHLQPWPVKCGLFACQSVKDDRR